MAFIEGLPQESTNYFFINKELLGKSAAFLIF